MTWLPSAQARDPHAVAVALQALAREADAVHFHVDLGVYDPSFDPAETDGHTAVDLAEHLASSAIPRAG